MADGNCHCNNTQRTQFVHLSSKFCFEQTLCNCNLMSAQSVMGPCFSSNVLPSCMFYEFHSSETTTSKKSQLLQVLPGTERAYTAKPCLQWHFKSVLSMLPNRFCVPGILGHLGFQQSMTTNPMAVRCGHMDPATKPSILSREDPGVCAVLWRTRKCICARRPELIALGCFTALGASFRVQRCLAHLRPSLHFPAPFHAC